jgi:23S rRNA pseudouridine1911/1915/1917 synthase
MSNFEFEVTELKTRLDKYLASKLPNISRSQIQKDIRAGKVLVNGKKFLESKFVVRKDDRILYHQPKLSKEKLTPANIPLKILYDNQGLLIVDKPAGLVVHPGAGFKGNSLASALLYRIKDINLVGEENRPGIVHRLDKDTSGIMLIAKTQEMYEYLKNAFAEKKIKKEYITLICGRLEKPYGVIGMPIGKSKIDFRKYATKDIIKPKEALTEYRVLEYLSKNSPPREGELEGVIENNQNLSELTKTSPTPPHEEGEGKNTNVDTYTLLLVKLHTGRTHQIRVHFNSLGHPVVGDKLYGGKKTRLVGLNRQFIHAKKIEVQLPNKTWIEAESDLTDDLKEVLRNLKSKLVNTL